MRPLVRRLRARRAAHSRRGDGRRAASGAEGELTLTLTLPLSLSLSLSLTLTVTLTLTQTLTLPMQTCSMPPHVDLRAIDAWLLSVRLRQHRSERPPPATAAAA